MRLVGKVFAVTASIPRVAGSTAAAAAPAAQAPSAQAPAPNAWMMLSALSSTRAVALGGASTGVQPGDVQPPPPPPVVAGTGAPVITGEVIGFAVWFALIVIALTLNDNGGRPNSPA